ncbi:hypothetical protein [Cognatishimia sp. MH4019]|uniref:hypothetical protein n=1 Tax=Cognatishimia sp. MH4019 TaxID=2854030 RepID=UPI001CD4F3D3|nr:hypothetical protein [Cognatishimia sp. MH4019]
MAEYSKVNSPPKSEPFLTTRTGLKYWLVKHKTKVGNVQSVLTEDAKISMHQYGGGGRDDAGSYLFNYHGTSIGFVCHEIIEGRPVPKKPVEKDLEKGIFIQTVFGIGTPVHDYSVLLEKASDGTIILDDRGMPKRRKMAVYSESLIAGPTWSDYTDGARGKFRSQQHQDEMLEIWPELFNGLNGALWRLQQETPKGLQPQMRFSERVLNELSNGDLL